MVRLAALTAALISTAAADAATPPLLWQGVERVGIQCLVVTEQGVDNGALRDRICELARSIAAEGAPFPIAIVAPGDPALLSPGMVTLLLHASIEPAEQGRLIALSVRPFRHRESSAQLFGAAPRAAWLAAGGDAAAAIEGPLVAALTETLPWRAGPAGPRRIQP